MRKLNTSSMAQVETLSSPPEPQSSVVSPSKRWIGGPVFDVLFFLFPTIFGLLFVLIYYQFYTDRFAANLMSTILFTIGFGHYMGTIFFYFDRKNLKRFLKEWPRFFLVPILIFIVTMAIALLDSRLGLLSFVLYVWTHQHLTKQNMGFVSFYRHKYGLFDEKEKKVDNSLIVSWAIFLYFGAWAFWPKEDDFPVTKFFSEYRHHFKILLLPLAIWAVWTLTKSIVFRWRSLRANQFQSWPHIAMIFTSVLFPLALIPAMFLSTNNLVHGALTFGLLAHYTQYIALLVLIHKHKYPSQLPSAFQGDEGKGSSQNELIFGRLPISPLWVFMIFITFFGLCMSLLHVTVTLSSNMDAPATNPLMTSIALGFILGSAFNHYYLDAVIWAFKNEENRKSILPYVKPFSAK